MRAISSTNNPKIQLIRKLKTKRGREKAGLAFIEGLRLVSDTLDRADFAFVGYTTNFAQDPKHESLIQRMMTLGIERVCFDDGLLGEISDTVTPQEVFAVVKIPVVTWEACRKCRRLLVLNGIQDPGNLGTMIRTAAALGMEAIITSKGTCDIANPKSLRAAMAATFSLPIVESLPSQMIIEHLVAEGYDIFVSALAKESTPLSEVEATDRDRFALVVGNEGAGVDPLWLEHATKIVTIPMTDRAESLNVNVACGIMIYHLVNSDK